MAENLLFSPATLGRLDLPNRMVMAPMTRCRAEDNEATRLMGEYYAQRASAGLIISEGVSPSVDGIGYANTPGIFTDRQIDAWKHVTRAVSAKGGRIFMQLMHTGRVAHPFNLPKTGEVLAPSAIAAPGEIFTVKGGMQPHPVPTAMTGQDIHRTQCEFVGSARRAVNVGFHGVEIHAANGYLLEQFLSPLTNQRTNGYGNSIPNRILLIVAIAREMAEAIGGHRVGIRLSPYGSNAGMEQYPETEATHLALVKALIKTGIQYIHIVDHSAMGAPPVPASFKQALRRAWPRTYIASGGFDAATAEAALQGGQADFVAFGRPFLSNPDLPKRMQMGLPLNPPDSSTFYTPGPKGYTDYPTIG